MIKNITLSADEELIEKARQKARKEHTSLNKAFRSWLAQYVGKQQRGDAYRKLMDRMSYVRAGRHFTRDELNAR